MSFVPLKNSEVAVLVLSTRSEQYDAFRDAVYSAWVKRLIDFGVICYFYAGDHPEEKIVEHEMQLTVSDRLSATAEKLVAALDLLLRSHPDIKLVYRTNLSSYVDPLNFLKYIKFRELDTNSYCGVVGTTTLLREKLYGRWWLYNMVRLLGIGRSIRFASGSGFFIGVNQVKKLLHGAKNLSLIDDVMVADALKLWPLECDAPPRFDILEESRHKINKKDYFRLVRENLLFHYRFKTSDRVLDARLLLEFSDPKFRIRTCVEGQSG
jgi:hypothetical protein